MLMNFLNVFIGTNVLFHFNDFVIIMIHSKRKVHNNKYIIRFEKISFSYRYF